MTVFLDGIATQFYRGIGDEIQYIAPFSQINFFIGANNAGKSIVLNLIATKLADVVAGQKPITVEGPEQYRGTKSGQFFIAIGRDVHDVSQKIMRDFQPQLEPRMRRSRQTAQEQVQTILANLSKDGQLWLTPSDKKSFTLHPAVDLELAKGWGIEWEQIFSRVTQMINGSHPSWVNEIVNTFVKLSAPNLPNIHLIPAKRTLGKKDEAFVDLSGTGLIDHLATLQNPDWDRQADREKFERINYFLRDVTGKANATLEIPSGREHLLVHMDNKVLPLESLGTGIHEVVLIAAFCTIHDKSIMCIEEPEIHLHPLLQRKLINYLEMNTSSQYFIATHSSAFIDTPASNIFHVQNDGNQTRVRAVITTDGRREILDDLGYHASDLLQTNSIIWVEGPSDRLYLNHWINAVDDRLVEGIHYTVMFYGGGLISHLSASDDAMDEFIKLRKLNRHMAIVLDSDKETVSDDLKPHAQRIVNEMAEGQGIVWVTAGREIENYVDGEKLQAALKVLHPKIYKTAGRTGQYDHAFYFWRDNPDKEGERKTHKVGNKVGAASIICDGPADLDQLDLRERIEELVLMICKANDL